MGDWLLHAARKLHIHEGSLNVMSGEFSPSALNIHPLVVHANYLKTIVKKELQANGFDADFLVDARIDFVIPDTVKYQTKDGKLMKVVDL